MSENNDSMNSGSHWQRWDPHAHAPGTLFNDLFLGDWDAYLTQLETATPPLRALGVVVPEVETVGAGEASRPAESVDGGEGVARDDAAAMHVQRPLGVARDRVAELAMLRAGPRLTPD